MAKVLRCGEMFPGCDFVARGETEEEVLEQGAAHAQEAHGINEVPPEMASQVRARIRDE